MTGEQRGLLCQDIQTLRDQRDVARRREIAAEAAATSAGLDVELLTLAIDNQLDALNEAEA